MCGGCSTRSPGATTWSRAATAESQTAACRSSDGSPLPQRERGAEPLCPLPAAAGRGHLAASGTGHLTQRVMKGPSASVSQRRRCKKQAFPGVGKPALEEFRGPSPPPYAEQIELRRVHHPHHVVGQGNP